MKRIIAYVGLLIILCTDIAAIEVEKGVIDLSKVDLTEDIVNLEGEWEFYWKTFTFKENFKQYIKVPLTWDKVNKVDGFATYRMKIKTKPSKKRYAFYFHKLRSSYKVFVNRQEVLRVGEISVCEEGYVPERKTNFIEFNSPGPEIEVVIHIASYDHPAGGIKSVIKFGYADQIKRMVTRKIIINTFCATVTFVIVFFTILLFKYQKKIDYLIHTSIMMLLFFYILLSCQMLSTIFIDVEWKVLVKIEHLILALAVGSFNYFISTSFVKKNNSLFVKGINSAVIIYCTIILLTEPITFISMLKYFYIVIAAALVYWVYIMICDIVTRRGSYVILLGFVIFIGISATQMAVINGIVHDINIFPFGIVALALSYIIIILRDYSSLKDSAIVVTKKVLMVEEDANNAKNEAKLLRKKIKDESFAKELSVLKLEMKRVCYLTRNNLGWEIYGNKNNILGSVDLKASEIVSSFQEGTIVQCSKWDIVVPSKIARILKKDRKKMLELKCGKKRLLGRVYEKEIKKHRPDLIGAQEKTRNQACAAS